ncbi:MAG: hypothetical protein ACLFU7_11195, partial [Armatimonadota bacterium]
MSDFSRSSSNTARVFNSAEYVFRFAMLPVIALFCCAVFGLHYMFPDEEFAAIYSDGFGRPS